MTDRNILLLAAAAVGAWLLLARPQLGAPELPDDVPNMASVFGETGRTDALHVAAVAKKQANALRAEALLPADQRCLTRSGDVIKLRVATIDVLDDAGVFARRYGERFATTVNAFFDARVGERDGALTDEQIGKWIRALEDFSSACRSAGGQ